MRTIRIRLENQNLLDDLETLLKDHPTYKVKLGKDHKQKSLPFWENMPEYSQVKQEPYALITWDTSLSSEEIQNLLKQNITDKTKSIWFPKKEKGPKKYWDSISRIENIYPIYIISKGRPKVMTSKALDKMGVRYRIVIEPCDLDAYLEYHPREKLLILPFENLGQGSIPVRNWVWDHSISEGYGYHWIMDDNIEDFNVLKDNNKYVARTPSIFRYAEEFVERHSNVGQAGLNYYSFCKSTDPVPPYYTNTRIYSCILIKNDIDLRWRGKYNEDTDLSIRILKSGLCTILFNQFLAGKVTTLRMKGGNTDHVYVDGDNRYKFAKSLADQHPDIVRVTTKFGRYHHHVNYKGFTQELKLKDIFFPDYTKDLVLKNY